MGEAAKGGGRQGQLAKASLALGVLALMGLPGALLVTLAFDGDRWYLPGAAIGLAAVGLGWTALRRLGAGTFGGRRAIAGMVLGAIPLVTFCGLVTDGVLESGKADAGGSAITIAPCSDAGGTVPPHSGGTAPAIPPCSTNEDTGGSARPPRSDWQTMYSKSATEACLRAQDVPLEEGRGRIAESASGGSLMASVGRNEILVLFISEPSELDSTADAYKRSGGDAYSRNNAVIAWRDSADRPTNDAMALVTRCLSATPAAGDEARDGRLSLHDYTAQAATICSEEIARLSAVGDGLARTLENLRRVTKQQAAVLETLTDRMSSLRPPERIQSDVDQMLSSYASAAAGFEKVSKAKDMADAERRFEENVSPNLAHAIQIADAIGIEGCEG